MTNTTTLPTDGFALDQTYFTSKVNPIGICPGFTLWDVVGSDGVHYMIDADNERMASWKLEIRSERAGTPLEAIGDAVAHGPNPQVKEWSTLRDEIDRDLAHDLNGEIHE